MARAARLKKDSAKAPQLPDAAQKKAGQKTRSAAAKTALEDVQKCKEHGIKTHLQANNTRTNYAGHVRRGREWLASHFETPSCSAVSETWRGDTSENSLVLLPATAEIHADNDVYEDPAFKYAFESIPNRCSDKALALFMSLKGFHENLSKTTVESIRLAFKKLWELSDGDTYRGKWHFNEMKQRWEGNPADSADIYDVLSSIKHKASAEGGDRTHSMAMTKDYMDRAFRWHQTVCPLEIALQMVQKVMSGARPSDMHLDLEMRTKLTRHLEQVTFASNGWTLWTRCFELVKLQRKDISLDTTILDGVLGMYLANETLTLSKCTSYFEIFLAHRKGWQKKVDKGQWEADLRSNHYKIYPRPNMPACDNFFWMLVWIKWLESFHYGRTLQPNDFIFPVMSANGVVHPGQPISHDTVQKWINESTTGAGIRGNFSTHCFRRGGAQYWFMFAPVGQRWTLAKVRWWGGWADGEQRDTLVRYLLDELYAYKTDYSDALAPISRGADASLAGEQALMRPASIEELHMVHSSVTTDVNNLRNDIGSSCASESRTRSPRPTPPYTPSHEGGHLTATHRPSPRAATSQSSILASQRPAATKTTPPSKNTTSQSLPTAGLVIPRVPVTRPNGTTSPKSKSWKEIIEHWLVGDPDRGLRTPLKDWPKEWYQGANRRFASKYHQRATIALEFINEYESNESRFLAAYPEAEMGHTQLLKAINEARAARGQRISRKK
ncbi:hypothetical protein DEU56DRAFT_738972 [Suillus clintonianus]|uniref:uncharacterized protein n=1 Tax=Suillus clintonianus TaxID=1904413 RepID=UPI001B884363|nr:uncharacterized protein DEU56DRAFT_738972 [Suillus clintonianus]KAG2133337.1 hypothetical protein DEU56DRAFT_738972 [Suillus clintonianus]